MGFINIYMLNMYLAGLIDTTKKEQEVAKISSLYNDYTIYLDRKPRVWTGATAGAAPEYTYNYICTFRLVNILGSIITQIHTSEIEIYKLIDNLYQIYNRSINNISIPINSFDSTYIFEFNRLSNNNIEFIIIGNNKKIIITFDNDKFESFTNSIYFIFLIDIDNLEEYNEIYNILY